MVTEDTSSRDAAGSLDEARAAGEARASVVDVLQTFALPVLLYWWSRQEEKKEHEVQHVPDSPKWVRDRVKSRTFFWNRRTRASSWNPPEGIRVVWVCERTAEGGVWYWHIHLLAESSAVARSLSRLSAIPAKPFPMEAA